jgi:hypothetical protein
MPRSISGGAMAPKPSTRPFGATSIAGPPAPGRSSRQRQGRPAQELIPTGADRFAEAGRPRVERLFRRDAAGRIDAFVDRRDNNDLVWVRLRD